MSFYIIYPGGDRSKISIVELNDAMKYELDEYALASRQDFEDIDETITYAKGLAEEHNKSYVGASLDGTDNDYLD